jgi:molecular chaperone GrpE
MNSQGAQPTDREEAGPFDAADGEQESQALTLEEELQQELERCRQEKDETLDKYRRSVAEFSNYRKRQERERDQQRTRISIDVLRKLLPIMDDFDRALASAPERLALGDSKGDSWLEGLGLIRRKLDGILDSYGVAQIEAVGKPFDPYFHEALMQAPSDEFPAGTVLSEVQRGYIMGDDVLRATLVTVSSGPASDSKHA